MVLNSVSLPSSIVLSGCQGQEISHHAEKIILHYLYCQFYSISECILSHSLTVYNSCENSGVGGTAVV